MIRKTGDIILTGWLGTDRLTPCWGFVVLAQTQLNPTYILLEITTLETVRHTLFFLGHVILAGQSVKPGHGQTLIKL